MGICYAFFVTHLSTLFLMVDYRPAGVRMLPDCSAVGGFCIATWFCVCSVLTLFGMERFVVGTDDSNNAQPVACACIPDRKDGRPWSTCAHHDRGVLCTIRAPSLHTFELLLTLPGLGAQRNLWLVLPARTNCSGYICLGSGICILGQEWVYSRPVKP